MENRAKNKMIADIAASQLERDKQIIAFIKESNRIEGITREPTLGEFEKTDTFLRLSNPDLFNLVSLTQVYQPDAVLRSQEGANVRVGDHIAPLGGPAIATELEDILTVISKNLRTPYDNHHRYETLHPFTDGNGRSGRALWLWQMERFHGGAPLGFLHTFYYQALQDFR